MDPIKTIGQTLTGRERRDAIHIAIAPVVASHAMLPGVRVGFAKGSTELVSAEAENKIGIIDPYFDGTIEKDDKVWLFLYPNTIKAIRHHWHHPAFGLEEAEVVDKEASEQWIKQYIRRHCPYDFADRVFNYGTQQYDPAPSNREQYAYNKFMERAQDGTIFYHGSDLHSLGELEDADELFHHLSILLERPVGGGDFEYSCSC